MGRVYLNAFLIFIFGLIFFFVLSAVGTIAVGALATGPYLSAVLYIYLHIFIDKTKDKDNIS